MFAIMDYRTIKLLKDKDGNTIWFKTQEKADEYIKKHKLKHVYVFLSTHGEFND